MEPPFEADVELSLQTLSPKQIAHGERSFARSLHQLPIRKRHCRHIRLHSTRHYIGFGP